MKTSALFAVCMAVATLLSADSFSGVDFLKCRDYNTEWGEGLSKTKMIEQDLIKGRWTAQHLEGERTYFFTDQGQLQIFILDEAGYLGFTTKKWSVTNFSGQPVLILTGQDGLVNTSFINQHCEGITLTDIATDEILSLDYHSFKLTGDSYQVENNLLGQWTNVTALVSENAGKSQKGVFLSYFFSDDGTYSLEYGNSQQNIRESGTWKVSKDSQFLLLEKEGAGCQVVRIGQVDDHGLVLEQVMRSSEINEFFDASNKMFAFIK